MYTFNAFEGNILTCFGVHQAKNSINIHSSVRKCDDFSDDLDLFTDFTAPLDPKYRAIAHEDDVVSRRDAIYDVYQRDYAEFLQVDHLLQNYSLLVQ